MRYPIQSSLLFLIMTLGSLSWGKMSAPDSHFVEAEDGVRVHYITQGQGTPVVLIHGYYADSNVNWVQNGIVEALAANHKVVAMDVRGHGQSDKPHNTFAYGANLWKDILLVMDDQGIEQAHFHGYSMGGALLTQILYHAPERVLSAIYGGSGIPEYDSIEIAKIPEDPEVPEELEEQEDEAFEQIKRDSPPDRIALHQVRINGPWQSNENQRIDLGSLNIPFLSLVGEFDSPNRRNWRMERELSDFQSVVIPGKAHLTTVTPGYMPQQYLDETLRFLNRF